MAVVYCENGCGRGVDAAAFPGHVRKDGSYVCGLDCDCGAPVPCPRVHRGTFTQEDVDILRFMSGSLQFQALTVRGQPRGTTGSWLRGLAERIEAVNRGEV